MFSRALVSVAAIGFLFLAGCASGTYQARQVERDKLAASTGHFCEFVNGEQHPDIDVELNMQMAKRCDVTKHYTVTNFRTSSEMNGVIYCCQTAAAGRREARMMEREARAERNMSSRPAAPRPMTKPAPAPSKEMPIIKEAPAKEAPAGTQGPVPVDSGEEVLAD